MRRLVSSVLGFAAFALAALPALAFQDSYTIGGLAWGSAPDEVAEQLRSKGFALAGVVQGPRREFVEDGAWGEYVQVDRGKRLVATGPIAGEQAELELVFGWNDRLQRVIVKWPEWNGTIPHAERLTRMASEYTATLEEQFGRPRERRAPFGWIDTARWQTARDGSDMELVIRGTRGFMFYPGDRTNVRMHLWNDRYAADDRKPAVVQAKAERPPKKAVKGK